MTKTSAARRLLRHYAEMVLAMFAGMVVLGAPLSALTGDGEMTMLVNMGVSMSLPMVGWMRYRGHSWRASMEMAASMIVPTLAAMVVYGTGLIADFDVVLVGEHVVMLAAMLGVMLLRPAEYVHHHHGAHAA